MVKFQESKCHKDVVSKSEERGVRLYGVLETLRKEVHLYSMLQDVADGFKRRLDHYSKGRAYY